MPTFQRCDKSIATLARTLIGQYEEHLPLDSAGVTIDFVFAYCDKDDKDRPLNDALTKNGRKALGIARIIPLKDRALGRADAEIALDGDWWQAANAEEQIAVLDHELEHLEVKKSKSGDIQHDDLHRPLLRLRKHDFEFGWFNIIAARHGAFSMERQQAKAIMDSAGQFYMPDVFGNRLPPNTAEVTKAVGAIAKAVVTKLTENTKTP